ncbi:hypothetical protein Q4534_13995 [Cyclobacterium sp. 1_MG-2023]|uniref:hypothetical protein n=1 Tax=Cyclobacterium sp. 1_MG-2023 TaxID=3062681 RepID=UPI0026E406B1|nr:hypothetical protein [Cyclobacterium sp. 1_MG-2023]MDO6438530.1 hypothetical protein [Cyclobacterium sp. 1_MG-2023]
MKTLIFLMISLIFLLPFSRVQGQTQISSVIADDLNGVYEGKLTMPEGKKYARFVICKTKKFYSGRQGFYDVVLKRTYSDNKKFDATSEALIMTGKYYIDNNDRIILGGISEIEINRNGNLRDVNLHDNGSVYFTKDKNKLIFREGTLKKVSNEYDFEKLIQQASQAHIFAEAKLSDEYVTLIKHRARVSAFFGRESSIGFDLNIRIEPDFEAQLEQKIIKAWYSYNDYYLRQGSIYKLNSVRSQILQLMNYFTKSGVSLGNINWLTHFPNAEEIEVFNKKRNFLDFRIKISRNDDEIKFEVIQVDFEKSLKEELSEFEKFIAYKEKGRKEAIQKAINEEGRYAINASGEIIDIYNPGRDRKPNSYQLELGYYFDEEVVNLYYGRFGKVNKHYFPFILNMFIIKSSKKFKMNVAKNPVISYQTLIQTPTETIGGVTYNTGKSERFDYKIYLDQRFLVQFENNVDTEQFSIRSDRQTRELDRFLEKYPPSSIVYKQVRENMYRYFKGIKPASSIDEIQD